MLMFCQSRALLESIVRFVEYEIFDDLLVFCNMLRGVNCYFVGGSEGKAN